MLTEGLLNRTLGNLLGAWRTLADPAQQAGLRVKPDLPGRDLERVRERMRECLAARGGVVSAKARAASLGQAYLTLNEQGKRRFLGVLAHDFALAPDALEEAIEAYRAAASEEARLAAEQRLRRSLRLPARQLLMQFNALPQGVRFLVDLRADLRRLGQGDPWLAHLEQDLKDLLSSWFDIGFLDLERLTWESPAVLLERLIEFEAVHEIGNFEALKRRLDASDRRVYGFFHPRMRYEPLIFVQVALSSGLPESIQSLLQAGEPEAAADTAVFYSISNAQPGLQGVNLGDFLIKRVVDDLRREFPRVRTFATLSPVPGLRNYVRDRVAEGGTGAVLSDAERESLRAACGHDDLGGVLATDAWLTDERVGAALRGPLLRLAAHYLVNERRRGRVLNPVANFHLSNGAGIERINWLADTSEKGAAESLGVMVNYLYNLNDIEKNHEAYRESCEVRVSASVRGLLAGA